MAASNSTPHLSKNELVKDYITKVSGLYEVEYGDFKRKLGAYTSTLEAALGGGAETKQVLNQIRQQVVFNSATNVEAAKDIVVTLASRLA